MKEYNEIKKIITQDLGYKSLEDYQAMTAKAGNISIPTPWETLEALSPDLINNQDFWKVADELFGFDPVCNQRRITPDWSAANRQNRLLAQFTGVLGWLEGCLKINPDYNIFEIGPGYGNIANLIEANYLRVTYRGIDVLPRIPGIMKATPQGLIPEAFVEKSFGKVNIVYSSNVFQHLSHHQREKYLKDAHKMLVKEGMFIVSLMLDEGNVTKGFFDEEGRGYMHHYGQFTPIPTMKEWMDTVKSCGYLINSYNVRVQDGYTSFLLSKKETE